MWAYELRVNRLAAFSQTVVVEGNQASRRTLVVKRCISNREHA